MSEERDLFKEAVEYGRYHGTVIWLATFVAPILTLGLAVLLLRTCGG